jgi:hypothetical protein
VRRLESEDGAAQTCRQNRHVVVQDDVELLARRVLVHPSELVELGALLRCRDVVSLLDGLGVLGLLLGDLRSQIVDRAHSGDRRGEDEVDAKGPVADLLANPLDVRLDLIGGVLRLSHHRESAGIGYGGYHVLAMGKGDDRVLDAQ